MAGGAAALLGGKTRWAEPATPTVDSAVQRPRPLKFSADMREGLKPRRVTNAMWDDSWLTQHYPGGAFADFGKAADELLERGFNTVRIDAFPLVIGHCGRRRKPSPSPAIRWPTGACPTATASTRSCASWWSSSALKRRGLSVILSSWGKDCKEYPDRKALAKDRDGFRKAWERTLDILGSHDLLGPRTLCGSGPGVSLTSARSGAS